MSRAEVAAPVQRGAVLLGPLAALYGAGVALARGRGLARRGANTTGARVVSIGNLEAGGSGKTPLAMHLLERAAAAGKRAAYVSRGYAGRVARAPYVTLCAPAWCPYPVGGGAHVLNATDGVDATVLGDEAALVTQRVPDALVSVCRDKRRAVEIAASLGSQLVIVDDAFQTWRLPRDLDVVLLDAERPIANERLLPAGPLRETPDALHRADVVVLNGAPNEEAIARARAVLSPWVAPEIPVLGLRRTIRLEHADAAPRPERVSRIYVGTAIARPGRFLADLAALGLTVSGARVFPDHHGYNDGDARALHAAVASTSADALVVTEKDWVKLRRYRWEVPVRVARLAVGLFGGALDVWDDAA